MVTWGNLKAEIIDLGFEEDDIATEYGRIIINSVNRALDTVYYDVEKNIADYYRIEQMFGYDDGAGNWVIPKPRHITENSLETDNLNIADNVHRLVALLASHWVWLDDDVTKATLYWNEYDQLKDQIIAACSRPRKAQIIGGVGF